METPVKNPDKVLNNLEKLVKELSIITDGSFGNQLKTQFDLLSKITKDFKQTGNDVLYELNELIAKLKTELREIREIQGQYPRLEFYLEDLFGGKLKIETIEKKQREALVFCASFHKDYIRNMISLGVFKPNTPIQRTFENVCYSGEITRDGHIQLEINGEKKYYQTFHRAARAVTKLSVNGLEFWRLRHPDNGTLVSIKTFLR